ncbi:hypothetical protein BDZ85DRAFT_258277 [Elsinoe ampelina]|uniref:F-box domain-containing protein n=1 Tax=Elsinoe ampelina TaxID=302913 RepID=A0A6A6GJH5_9PEZI|nr:hypothetical protein BDZ85DRAFT_258277 [Elsinoe ampelina]
MICNAGEGTRSGKWVASCLGLHENRKPLSNMATSILDLPTETFFLVADQLDCRHSLASLSLTCKLLNKLCLPKLWETVEVVEWHACLRRTSKAKPRKGSQSQANVDPSIVRRYFSNVPPTISLDLLPGFINTMNTTLSIQDRFYNAPIGTPWPHLYGLLRTLLLHPQLCEFVRHLKITNHAIQKLPRSEYHKFCKTAPEAVPGTSEAFVRALRAHVRSLQQRLGLHESHLLSSLKGSMFDDGYLGLLLSLLGPRLRSLDFSESVGEHRRHGGQRILHESSARWINFLVAWPQNFLPDFPVPVLCAVLKRLTVRRIDRPGCVVCVASVLELAKSLPFCQDVVVECGNLSGGGDVAATYNNVRRLELDRCHATFGDGSVGSTLRSTGSLKTFCLVFDQVVNPGHAYPWYLCPSMNTGELNVGLETLEDLTIGCHYLPNRNHQNYEHAMRESRKLFMPLRIKRLHIDHGMLCRYSSEYGIPGVKLPPGLEEVRLMNFQSVIHTDGLQTLLEKNDLPALRILIIELEPKRLRLRMQQLDLLRFISLCTRKSIECIVVENLRQGTFLRSSSPDLRLWKRIRRPGWRELLEM